MANVTILQNNFTSGEIDPLLEAAIMSPRYQTGLRLCQNFLPMRQGGLRKRPGTWYDGNTKSNAKARLIEFTAATGEYFTIELTNLVARMWKEDFTLVGGGTPTELVTPWTTAQLFDIEVRVMKGVLWVVHPSHAPRTITVAAGVWSIATPTFTGDRTFSTTNNYPKIIFFRGGRLGLGATNAEPNAIFLSRSPNTIAGTDRFTDFTMGTSADHAIYLQEADTNGTHIHWAIGQRRLIIGTDRSIWADTGGLVTPSTFDTNLVAYTGSEEVPPVLVENIAIYVGRGGTSLHALVFSEEGGGFVDYDLSKDATHFLSSPVVDMKIMNYPEPILWMARADGLLVSCTLDFKNGMVGWARHPMGEGAVVESIAVGLCATEDNVWLSVLRGSVRTIEHMRFCNLNTSAQEDFHFVDNGLAITLGSPSATVTGLSHLEGMDVTAWADGAVMPTKTVASGQVVYDRAVTKIHIGLPIESEAETLRPETPANGTSQGKQKKIEKVIVRIYRSGNGKIGATNGTSVSFLTWRSGTYLWGSAPALFTGDLEAQIASILNQDATLKLVHHDPSPFTLLGIIYRVGITEV